MTIKKVPVPMPTPQPEDVPMTERDVYEQQVWEALKPMTFRRWTVFEPAEDKGPPEEE